MRCGWRNLGQNNYLRCFAAGVLRLHASGHKNFRDAISVSC